MKHTLTTLLIAISSIALQPVIVAAPAYPHPVNYQLPDGTEITIQMMGDEWVNWAVSPDGYTLLTNKDGFWEYAIQDKSGDLKLSGIRAHNKPERKTDEQRFLERQPRDLRFSAPQLATKHQSRESVSTKTDARIQRKNSSKLPEEMRIVVILVEFADKTFVKENEDFDRLFNQLNLTSTPDGPVTGSVKDYFMANSNGATTISADVYGPFKLPDTIGAYSGRNSGSPSRMAREAVEAARAAGCDFSKYDANKDGVVDVIHIIFAGHGGETGLPAAHSIWSHAGQVQGTPTYNGVRLTSYSCSPELRSNTGRNITHIGVIVHELGHGLFGIPDFYDTGTEGSVALGHWCVMASGTWLNDGRTPPLFSAYVSSSLGWVRSVELTIPTEITLPNPAEERVVYRINTPETNEYYLIENRQRQGWDAFIPGSGMLIYHVDRSAWTTWTTNSIARHRGYYLKQAGCSALHGCLSGRDTDPWPQPGKTEFTDETMPNSITRTGQSVNKPITHITRNDTERTVSFRFRGGTPPAVDAALTEIRPSKLWGEGEQDIKVKLESMGIMLTSATVSWTVNDVEQTPCQWEGNLAVDEYEMITIGKIVFEQDTIYNITVIVNANGDAVPQNDTIRTTLKVLEETPFFFEDFEKEGLRNWNLVNANTNKWFIGTATSASGDRSAYISNDGGVSNNYTLNDAQSFAYLEIRVDFPESDEDFDLYFDVRCMGEFSDGVASDYLEVRVGESRSLATSFGRFYNMPAWEPRHIVLPSSFSGSNPRLIFTWYNNLTNGNQPPAAVDNIAIVARSVISDTAADPPDPPITALSSTTPETSSMKAWMQNGILHIEGLTVGDTYRIYTIAGTLVYQGIATTNIVGAKNFSPLPSGTYIIQSQNKSAKFVW